MSSFLKSVPGRMLLLVLGLVFLIFLFTRVGVAAALHETAKVGWMFLVVFFLVGLTHFLRTLSWVRLLRMDKSSPSFLRMLALWLAGEAISHLSFSWSGETFRVVATRKHVPANRGAVAMALGRLLYSLAGIVLVLAGLVLALTVLDLPAGLRQGILGAVLGLVAMMLLAYVALRKSGLGRTPGETRPFIQKPGLESRLRQTLRDFWNDCQVVLSRSPGEFAFLLGLNLLAALVGVAEVWLILAALGAPTSLATAFLVEAFLKVLSGLAYFVPGNIGVSEGGILLLLKTLKFSAATGLALALVRRARALAWVGVGVGCLLFLGLRTEKGTPADSEMVSPRPEKALGNLSGS